MGETGATDNSGDGGTFDSVKAWIGKNKLTAIGSFWVANVAGCLAYQSTQPYTWSIRMMHTRVYAQFATLAALAGAAFLDSHFTSLETKAQVAQHMEVHNQKLEEVTKLVRQMSTKDAPSKEKGGSWLWRL